MRQENKSPEVRFKRFTEEWEEFQIGNLVSEKHKPIMLVDDETYNLITVKRRNEGIVSRGSLKGKNILVKNYFTVSKGDYVISKRQVVHGATGIVPDHLHNAVVSNEYLTIVSNDKITSTYWSLISTIPEFQKMFFLSSYGVDIEKLVFDVSDWKKRKISIPTLKEQKELVETFHNISTLISNQNDKHSKLKQFKKAMLGKMFPKEESNVPELRFKGFSKDWQLVQFKEVAELRRGLTYSPNDVASEGIKVLRSSNINEDSFIENEDDVFVNKEAVHIEYVKENDILITAANGSNKLVGKHTVIEKSIENTVHGGFMLIARTDKPYFLNASMSSKWYELFIKKYAAGGNGAISNLKSIDLEQQQFHLPSIEEQLKIGLYFRNLDEIIRNKKLEIKKLETIKKACLNKLFISQKPAN